MRTIWGCHRLEVKVIVSPDKLNHLLRLRRQDAVLAVYDIQVSFMSGSAQRECHNLSQGDEILDG